MKEVKEKWSMWKTSPHIPGREIRHWKGSIFIRYHLDIQCNPSSNPSRLFYGCWKTNSDIYIGRQRTQNGYRSVEGEKLSFGGLMLPNFKIQYEAVENQGSALEREDC